MKENHSPTPNGKLSSADSFYSLSFFPHQVAIAVNESIMVPPIRSRNTGHLSIKVNNVITFTVTDFHNKVIHNKVKKKDSTFSGRERDVVGEKNDYYKKIITWQFLISPI